MKQKKSSGSIFVFAIIIIFCSFIKSNIKNELAFTVQIKKWETIQNENYLILTTTLTNLSADTIKYYSMSCSWQDLYRLDSKSFTIELTDCDKNVTELIKIAPHENQSRILRLQIKPGAIKPNNEAIRVGFKFADANQYDSLLRSFITTKDKITAFRLQNLGYILWSNKLIVQ